MKLMQFWRSCENYCRPHIWRERTEVGAKAEATEEGTQVRGRIQASQEQDVWGGGSVNSAKLLYVPRLPLLSNKFEDSLSNTVDLGEVDALHQNEIRNPVFFVYTDSQELKKKIKICTVPFKIVLLRRHAAYFKDVIISSVLSGHLLGKLTEKQIQLIKKKKKRKGFSY